MPFRIQTSERSAGGRTGLVVTLLGQRPDCRLEVWTAHGFNALRWQAPDRAGSLVDLIYVDPGWDEKAVPTRSGYPILFPFPGRLRGGRLPHAGGELQLPLTESSGKHAIHGFTPRLPWRMVGAGAEADHAWVTGEFTRADVPDGESVWPSDFRLSVTHKLTARGILMSAEVANPGREKLPWGLGFHPYFRHPGQGADGTVDRCVLHTPMARRWVLDDSLPTGEQEVPPSEKNFASACPIGETILDEIYTASDDEARPRTRDGLAWRATLTHADAPGALTLNCSTVFRELVLFTPQHRKAVAIEPYTCTGDAASLQARGLDAGWRTLAPGASVAAEVEYVWDAAD